MEVLLIIGVKQYYNTTSLHKRIVQYLSSNFLVFSLIVGKHRLQHVGHNTETFSTVLTVFYYLLVHACVRYRMPQILREHKKFVEIHLSSIKRKYHLGGGGVVFNIKYSSTKPVPHLSMKIYEYHHITLKVITERINSYTLEVTACNSCCFTGNVFLEIEQVHCHTAVITICRKTFTLLLQRTSLPHTPLCCQGHSNVSCGCTQSIRQSVQYSLHVTALISASMNSKQSAKDMFQ